MNMFWRKRFVKYVDERRMMMMIAPRTMARSWVCRRVKSKPGSVSMMFW